MVRIQWVPKTVSDIKVSCHSEDIGNINLSVKIIDDGLNFYFYFYFYFYFLFYYSFLFLFLEQLRLGVISHAVTSVTT